MGRRGNVLSTIERLELVCWCKENNGIFALLVTVTLNCLEFMQYLVNVFKKSNVLGTSCNLILGNSQFYHETQ